VVFSIRCQSGRSPTPDYGYVGRPNVQNGWQPYEYGRWTRGAPYGGTWVGYEPWGWWPYHTGWWWPSPVFGWVWCPYHSFVSVHFTFGHSRFFGHHARFFPATVRFVGSDRFVRWVPSRPGKTRSDSLSFARGDGDVRSPGARGGNPGVSRPRSSNRGDDFPSVQRGRGSRSFSGSGGRSNVNPGIHRGSGRSSAVSAPALRAGGISRVPVRGGFSPSSTGAGSRGAAGSLRNATTNGGNRGFSGGFSSGSSGGSRGYGRNR
jgi:hypothetical protein